MSNELQESVMTIPTSRGNLCKDCYIRYFASPRNLFDVMDKFDKIYDENGKMGQCENHYNSEKFWTDQ